MPPLDPPLALLWNDWNHHARCSEAAGKNDPWKAGDSVGISPWVGKEVAKELAHTLTLLFQTLLDTGIVPADWRTAYVIPVFKKRDRYKPGNYWPISLTSIPCKIHEHIIISTIMDCAEKHGMLCPEQCAQFWERFRKGARFWERFKGRSCES